MQDLPNKSRHPYMVSGVLGLLGLLGSLTSLQISDPPWTISLVWSHVFPSLAFMAFGVRRGAPAAIAALIPFLLWPNNGWANVVTSFLYLGNFMWLGLIAGWYRNRDEWYLHPFLLHIPFLVLYFWGTILLYPQAFRLNPAPWSPESLGDMAMGTIQAIAVKGSITFYAEAAMAWMFLTSPALRWIMGLPTTPAMRKNHFIISGTILVSLLTWAVYILLNRIFVDRIPPFDLPFMQNARDAFALPIFVVVGAFAGAIATRVVEHWLAAEDSYRQSREDFLRLMDHSSDVLWTYDLDQEVLTYASPGTAHYGGMRPEALVGPGANVDFLAELGSLRDQFEHQRRRPLSFTRVFERTMPDGGINTTEVSATLVPGPGEGVRLIGVSRDISERSRADAAVRRSLSEKEALLKELYHRTKNNMMVIMSLLRLQAKRTGNPDLEMAFDQACNRIQAMALVHQKLYETKDLAQVDLGDYLRTLVNNLVSASAMPETVTVSESLIACSVGMEVAMTCGLLVNEAVTNSLKHGRVSPGAPLSLHVVLYRPTASDLELSLCDSGPGLAPGFDESQDAGMGLQLVRTLAESQLRGKLALVSPGNCGGLELRVRFQPAPMHYT